MKLWLNIFLINVINGYITKPPTRVQNYSINNGKNKSLEPVKVKTLQTGNFIVNGPNRGINGNSKALNKNSSMIGKNSSSMIKKNNLGLRKKRQSNNKKQSQQQPFLDPMEILINNPKTSSLLLLMTGMTLGLLFNDMTRKKEATTPKPLTFDNPLQPKIDINQPVDQLTKIIKGTTGFIGNYTNPQHVQLRNQFNNLFHHQNTSFFKVFQNILSSKDPDYTRWKNIAITVGQLMDVTNTFVDDQGVFDQNSWLNGIQTSSNNLEKNFGFLLFMSLGSANTIFNLLNQLDKFTTENINTIKSLYKNNEEEQVFEYKLLKIIQSVLDECKNVANAQGPLDWKATTKRLLQKIIQEVILLVKYHTEIEIIKITKDWTGKIDTAIKVLNFITFEKETTTFIQETKTIIDSAIKNIVDNQLDTNPKNLTISNNNLMYFLWKFLLSFLQKQNIDNKKILREITYLKKQLEELTDQDYTILKTELCNLLGTKDDQGNPLDAAIIHNNKEIIHSYLQYQRGNLDHIIAMLVLIKDLIGTSFQVFMPLIQDNVQRAPAP